MSKRRPSSESPTRRLWMCGAVLVAGCLGSSMTAPRTLVAQSPDGLSGTWTLDRAASQFPREVGFGADFFPLGRGDSNTSGGRPGRRGGASAGGPLPQKPQGESFDDAQRRQSLTDEVRLPPARLTIVDTPDVVTFIDDRGAERRVHPDGRAETLSIGGLSVLTVAQRDGGKLIVLYSVADLRQIRYTYAHLGPASLAIDVEFIERNKAGDTIKRIYNSMASVSTTAVDGGSPATSLPSGSSTPKTVVPRAGSEFAGLKRIGIVVEELGEPAIACGLKRETLQTAAAKPFATAGLKTSMNSDEDTYLQVTVMTMRLPTGICTTRYDWSLYSMTDATLSYQRSPLLTQVLLAHQGGLSGGALATHATDVLRNVEEGVSRLAAIIRDANAPKP